MNLVFDLKDWEEMVEEKKKLVKKKIRLLKNLNIDNDEDYPKVSIEVNTIET